MSKKNLTTILSLVTLSTFLLSACAPAASSTTEAPMPTSISVPTENSAIQATAVPVSVELNTTYENAVSIEQQLILGTFKLEGTNLAVSKEQAGILILLYTNLKTIVEITMPAQDVQSDPANAQPQTVNAETQAQVDTIIKDILAAMTTEQVKAISEMQITHESAQILMTEKGISMGGPGQGGAMPNANGQPPEGAPPAGGPEGNGNTPQGGAPNASQLPDGRIVPPELINILIELLQTK